MPLSSIKAAPRPSSRSSRPASRQLLRDGIDGPYGVALGEEM